MRGQRTHATQKLLLV